MTTHATSAPSPEAPIEETTPKAAIWRRLAALAYDAFILLAISFAYGAVLTVIGANLGKGAEKDYQPMFEHSVFFIGWITVLISFYVWFWHRGGQTLGMRTWRIQLTPKSTDATTGNVSLKQIFMRVLVGIPSFWLFGVGYWYRFFNAEKECLHDALSKTRVIQLPKPDKTKR